MLILRVVRTVGIRKNKHLPVMGGKHMEYIAIIMYQQEPGTNQALHGREYTEIPPKKGNPSLGPKFPYRRPYLGLCPARRIALRPYPPINIRCIQPIAQPNELRTRLDVIFRYASLRSSGYC